MNRIGAKQTGSGPSSAMPSNGSGPTADAVNWDRRPGGLRQSARNRRVHSLIGEFDTLYDMAGDIGQAKTIANSSLSLICVRWSLGAGNDEIDQASAPQEGTAIGLPPAGGAGRREGSTSEYAWRSLLLLSHPDMRPSTHKKTGRVAVTKSNRDDMVVNSTGGYRQTPSHPGVEPGEDRRKRDEFCNSTECP
ncbi:uncharacterized protein KD926_011010 [Aspergillus affinis]|uniref:uncharacterized protein n=1 Tax=Aspergillus affinis TaxID=1070780 RepID=UPI0022FF31FE|nr:uncharacterized protein KD926_011010 [Aspergillus affinis]KAI9044837.1 hypothetical protein KD926_011010 [Aspergillus affinis]